MKFLFFAQFSQDPDEFALQLTRMSPQTRERMLILGAIAVVILLVLCWAAFFRKRPRHKRGHIKRDRHSIRKGFADGWTELKRVFAQRDRQRKRTRHRPRNPTRAEVGGLPESRDEAGDPSPPSNV
jgi:FtsZ-interacting cell division protein ZipA